MMGPRLDQPMFSRRETIPMIQHVIDLGLPSPGGDQIVILLVLRVKMCSDRPKHDA